MFPQKTNQDIKKKIERLKMPITKHISSPLSLVMFEDLEIFFM